MNPLTDVLPARVRQIAYAVLFVAALVFAGYQASDGDWGVFAGSLVTSLLGLLAATNTKTTYDGTIDPYYANSATKPSALNVTTPIDDAMKQKTVTLEVYPRQKE